MKGEFTMTFINWCQAGGASWWTVFLAAAILGFAALIIRVVCGQTGGSRGRKTLWNTLTVLLLLFAAVLLFLHIWGDSIEIDWDKDPVSKSTTAEQHSSPLSDFLQGITERKRLSIELELDTETAEKEEIIAIPKVCLSLEEVDAFWRKYGDLYDNSTAFSRRTERVAAIRPILGSDEVGADAPNFPDEYARENIDDLRKFSTLTAERQNELEDTERALKKAQFAHDPATVFELAEACSELECVMRNNSETINWFRDKTKEAYAITLEEVIASNGEKSAGIDCFLEKRSIVDPTIFVTSNLEYRIHVAELASVFDSFVLRGVTKRMSVANWHEDVEGKLDSYTRIIRNVDYQTDQESLLWTFTGNNTKGYEMGCLGTGTIDQRVMVYKNNEQEPTPTPAPEPEKEPAPEKNPPKTITKTYAVYRVSQDEVGNLIGSGKVAIATGVKAGTTVTVSPEDFSGSGYTHISTRVSTRQKNEDTPGTVGVEVYSDVVVTNTYRQTKTTTLTFAASYECVVRNVDGTVAKVLREKTNIGYFAEDAEYNLGSNPTFDGYTCVSSVPKGKIPKSGVHHVLEYEPNLYYRSVCQDSSGKMIEVLQDYKLDGHYRANKKVTFTLSERSGYIRSAEKATFTVGNQVTYVDLVYTKATKDLYLYIHRGYREGGAFHDIADIEKAGPYKSGDEFTYHNTRHIGNWASDEYSKPVKFINDDIHLYFVYRRGNDGEGVKDPTVDPAPSDNAPVGGGDNQPSDIGGKYEPTKVTPEKYPETPAENPAVKDVPSSVTLTLNDPHDSSGTGGKDHNITDENGGNTVGGDVPELVPDPVVTNQGVKDKETGQTTNIAQEKPAGNIALPD